MYRCFKLLLNSEDFLCNDKEFIKTCKATGDSIKKSLNDSFKTILSKSIDNNGVISGEKFIDTWFHVDTYDVFLSYSHDDEELALLLAGFLKKYFGLNVFIDELFWGSADLLLHEFDDKYCKNYTGNYNYKKRNFSTTHVHAMLSTAIARVIDNSEITIFLNSENATYKVKDEFCKERTLSPWIFEEIFYTSIIRRREWSEYRLLNINETATFSKELKVSYLLPSEHLILLNYDDLRLWCELWEERKNNDKGKYGNIMLPDNEKIKHPLNVLYDFKCGKAKEGK